MNKSRQDVMTVAGAAAIILIWFTIVCGMGFVAFHFITKFW